VWLSSPRSCCLALSLELRSFTIAKNDDHIHQCNQTQSSATLAGTGPFRVEYFRQVLLDATTIALCCGPRLELALFSYAGSSAYPPLRQSKSLRKRPPFVFIL
jgi:hypothetical protein